MYSDIVLLSLDKSLYFKLGFQLIDSKGIKCNHSDDLSLCKINMFFVEMESGKCVSTELWLKGSVWLVGR